MEKRKKKIGITTKIFISLLLGTVAGIALHELVPSGFLKDTLLLNGVFYVVGNGFLRAMQMLVVPLVLSSLVCGVMAIGDSKKIGKVGVKTIIFYLLTTTVAITLALGVAKIINPGMGLDISSIQSIEPVIGEVSSFTDVLLDVIPKNPIQALAQGNMLQIIFFAILVGIIVAKQGEKAKTVADFFSQFNNIMMDMTSLVMKAAPYGVFCLIAKTFSEIGFEALVPMFKYIIGVYIALSLHLVVYMILLKGFTGINPIKFIKKYLPVMGFAFSTASSNATIPLAIETLDKQLGVSRRISSFTIPLGATINMDGTAIMQGIAVVFVAQAFNITLTPADYLMVITTATLASIGTAGVPGVGLITLSMVFASIGLPVEGIALIMGIDRIVDMGRTVVNITGDAVCTTVVASQDKAFDKKVFEAEV